ncbi:hypothetical protein T265_11115 [Opisthorchis viverrini]|uniref:Uncharacterized protein n=1 Tax=Opisthorchis viverrini TaxID=6198 RepID=A0A074Z469_OPIVI|nr:hypothetical protein T265_11115 [Opisthorchis viverrini]KER20307.1 hypothetical protein T265_11115 [Opisthorchis viverrini]
MPQHHCMKSLQLPDGQQWYNRPHIQNSPRQQSSTRFLWDSSCKEVDSPHASWIEDDCFTKGNLILAPRPIVVFCEEIRRAYAANLNSRVIALCSTHGPTTCFKL